MVKIELPPGEAFFPAPVVLVTCHDNRNQRANAITVAWCGIVASDPPQVSVSIRPSRHSHPLIRSERCFVINIPPVSLLKKTDLCGAKSGKDIDKFEACAFTAIPAKKITAPMIKECPINLECVLDKTLELGSHDMFIGRVVAAHADKGLLDQRGRLDHDKARPFVFLGGEYWGLGRKVGHYGFSQE